MTTKSSADKGNDSEDDDGSWKEIANSVKKETVLETKSKETHVVHCPAYPAVSVLIKIVVVILCHIKTCVKLRYDCSQCFFACATAGQVRVVVAVRCGSQGVATHPPASSHH